MPDVAHIGVQDGVLAAAQAARVPIVDPLAGDTASPLVQNRGWIADSGSTQVPANTGNSECHHYH